MSAIPPFLVDARDFLPILAAGVGMTVAVTLGALAVSLALGGVWALMGRSHLAFARGLSRTVITAVRGVPIIVQLFYVYFVLPQLGVQLDGFVAAVVGLGVAYSVYQAENFRAGFAAVDPALLDAAHALGLSERKILVRITGPLGLRVALPPLGSTAVMLLKDSSIASTITVAELTRSGQLLAVSTFKNMTVYTLIALIYLAMSLPLGWVARRLEIRFAVR